MPVDTQVGLDTRNMVLDGDLASSKKGHSTPTFRPVSIVAKQPNGSRCHLVRR